MDARSGATLVTITILGFAESLLKSNAPPSIRSHAHCGQPSDEIVMEN